MDPGFWLDRWREGRIGFHEGRPNTFLERHAGRLAGARRVLVPLCGKAEDLAYLAGRGHEIVGVELVEDAVKAFFAEHGATPAVRGHGPFVEYRAGAITILAGDMFATTRALLGPIDAYYDRAAVIALPPPLRARYVPHLRGLLDAGAPGLVITLEYEQARMDGPPFAVHEDELRALYAGAQVELIEEAPATGNPRLLEIGGATERCFVITGAATT
ncbi:MAG TPA: thiopurine S-methyltransferase [Kofleriaceae bacterium]|jgi:thiopurine S-methyltransferase|nr:thiopurine S-methyltransferase [Kofleriaceae bacterium]